MKDAVFPTKLTSMGCIFPQIDASLTRCLVWKSISLTRYRICRRFLLIDGSRFVASFAPPDSENDAVRAVKYLPSAVNLAADLAMFFNIHCLHFYPQGPFSHRFDTAIRVYDQTWTFLGEHCTTTVFNKVWKSAMASRETEVGSGRRRPAEKEAFAMAN